MPEFLPFRGIRYALGAESSPADVGPVAAPPYDVIDKTLQEDLYKKHPCNVVRLILNRKEPGDDETDNCYARARDFLKVWQREGVLFTEADPALYVYHQQFTFAGVEYNRRGFMGRLRLSLKSWWTVIVKYAWENIGPWSPVSTIWPAYGPPRSVFS